MNLNAMFGPAPAHLAGGELHAFHARADEAGMRGTGMHHPLGNSTRVVRVAVLVTFATALAALVAACGTASTGASTGGNAKTLLKQTFGGSHKVNSGQLSFKLTLTPSGSSSFSTPVTLAFSGPFQTVSGDPAPQSDFTVSISAEGHTGSLSVLSTGTKGYVSVSGVSYQLPASDFKQLESSFTSVSNPTSTASGKGTLGKLGIDPLSWLVDPQIAGTGTISGTPATEIKAHVDVPALLRGLNTLLGHASALGLSSGGTNSLSAAEQAQIAKEIKSPSIVVWSGKSDKTVRQLALGLTLPVSGEISTLLGGLTSAGLSLQLSYADLNKPQTITAPTKIQPYSVFQKKLANVVTEVEAVIAEYAEGTSSSSGSSTTAGSGSSSTAGAAGSSSTAGAAGSSSTAGAAGSSTSGAGSAGTTSAYSKCITAAGSDVSKMQKCASLLGSG
jgi:hypothetical protein